MSKYYIIFPREDTLYVFFSKLFTIISVWDRYHQYHLTVRGVPPLSFQCGLGPTTIISVWKGYHHYPFTLETREVVSSSLKLMSATPEAGLRARKEYVQRLNEDYAAKARKERKEKHRQLNSVPGKLTNGDFLLSSTPEADLRARKDYFEKQKEYLQRLNEDYAAKARKERKEKHRQLKPVPRELTNGDFLLSSTPEAELRARKDYFAKQKDSLQRLNEDYAAKARKERNEKKHIQLKPMTRNLTHKDFLL